MTARGGSPGRELDEYAAALALPPHVEAFDAMGCTIGRDPRTMTKAELEAIGHPKTPLLKLIRRNCVECAGGNEADVRRCSLVRCPFWPYRMNSNPHAAEQSPAQRAALAERLNAVRGQAGRVSAGTAASAGPTAAEPAAGAEIPGGASPGAEERPCGAVPAKARAV